jgi:hypothetical protein
LREVCSPNSVSCREARDGYMGGSKPNWPNREARSANDPDRKILPPCSSWVSLAFNTTCFPVAGVDKGPVCVPVAVMCATT